MILRLKFLLTLTVFLLVSACNNSAGTAIHAPKTNTPLKLSLNILNRYPHDTSAFTQGLFFDQGQLYESTGGWGKSWLRRVNLDSGQVQMQADLSKRYFGEGSVAYADKIYQLTWRARKGFVYDKSTLKLLSEFNYKTEGWGITHNGVHFIVSDGSEHLYFWDIHTLKSELKIQVRDEQGPVDRLNELEYINGFIYANVWLTNIILKIDPESGQVVGRADLSNLVEELSLKDSQAVLNGIAFDSNTQRLFVTGKYWPTLFEIELTN